MRYISGIPEKRIDLNCKAPAEPGIFYHYTSLNTLWAILESETLRATQARFSNDSEEIKKGAQILEEICRSCEEDSVGVLSAHAHQLRADESDNIDCYIVCFCGDKDVLSQWRGYCRSDGVSIGFAFDQTEPHFFLKDEASEQQCPHKIQLFPVWYVREETDGDASDHTISKEELATQLKSKLKTLYELEDGETSRAFIHSAIPLIKHAGFREENEYRLLICNTQAEYGGKTSFPLDNYVKYADGDGMKRPYITISFGRNNPPKSDIVQIKLYGLSEVAEKELRDLLEYKPRYDRFSWKKDPPKYNLERIAGNWDDNPQIIIGQADECAQKEAFEVVDRILSADRKKKKNQIFSGVNLWCEGHLPIRSIQVSPCENQKEVIESIKHYCLHHKFWLKYVHVTGSSTPYRRPK